MKNDTDQLDDYMDACPAIAENCVTTINGVKLSEDEIVAVYSAICGFRLHLSSRVKADVYQEREEIQLATDLVITMTRLIQIMSAFDQNQIAETKETIDSLWLPWHGSFLEGWKISTMAHVEIDNQEFLHVSMMNKSGQIIMRTGPDDRTFWEAVTVSAIEAGNDDD